MECFHQSSQTQFDLPRAAVQFQRNQKKGDRITPTSAVNQKDTTAVLNSIFGHILVKEVGLLTTAFHCCESRNCLACQSKVGIDSGCVEMNELTAICRHA
jgi:hypothetical protein